MFMYSNRMNNFQLSNVLGSYIYQGQLLRPLFHCVYDMSSTDSYQSLEILFYILFHSLNSKTYTSTKTARYRGQIAARSRVDGLSRHQIYNIDRRFIISMFYSNNSSHSLYDILLLIFSTAEAVPLCSAPATQHFSDKFGFRSELSMILYTFKDFLFTATLNLHLLISFS